MPEMHDKRTCSNCKQTKHTSFFYKRGNRFRSHCIDCIADKRIQKISTLKVSTPQSKICGKCGIDKCSSDFHKNSTVKDGLASLCKKCKSEYDASVSHIKDESRKKHSSNSKKYRREWYESNKLLKRFYTAKRRSLIKNATPVWQDAKSIRDIYMNCPSGYEVDHIVPIVSDIVCGLHVSNNLQYLTRAENIKKGNKLV